MDNHYLIYDNNCQICIKALKQIDNLNLKTKIIYVPLSNVKLPEKYTIPPISELSKELHLFCPDGIILKGAKAIAHIYLLSDSKKSYGKFLNLPIVSASAQVIYALVASLRNKISKK